MQFLEDKKTISSQLTLLILIAVLISTTFYFILNAAGNKVVFNLLSGSEYVDKQNDYYAKDLQEYVDEKKVSFSDDVRLNNWAEEQKILYFDIFKDNNWVFSSSSNTKGRPAPGDELSSDSWHKIKFVDGTADVFFYGNYTYRFYYYALAAELILSFVAFMIIVLLGIRRTIRYIKQIKNEIEILEGGDLNHVVTVKGNNELAELAESLECMRTSLQNQMANESELMHMNNKIITELSHDIRTPLTTIMLYSEAIKHKKYKNEEELIQYSNRIEDKINQLKYLTDTIFERSRKFDLDIADCPVQSTFEDLFFDNISGMTECLEQAGFHTETEIKWSQSKIFVYVEDVDRIINNLLSNILKYADKTEPVKINSSEDGEYVKISFRNTVLGVLGNDDSGMGIKNIFEMMERIHGTCHVINEGNNFEISLLFRRVDKIKNS